MNRTISVQIIRYGPSLASAENLLYLIGRKMGPERNVTHFPGRSNVCPSDDEPLVRLPLYPKRKHNPMPRKTLSRSLLVLIIFSFTSCATIIHGSRQGMFLTCEPRVASVYVDGKYVGNTPMNMVLSRGKDHQLRIELAGYKPFETMLTRRLDGWVFGNLLLVGIALDAFNGSMYRLTPKNLYPELTPDTGVDSHSRVADHPVELPDTVQGQGIPF